MPEQSPTTGAVFISYCSQDAEAAGRIAEVLRAAGVEVWLDQSTLRAGDAWDSQIRKQIHECALFLPVISAQTNARSEGYFRREWNLATHRLLDMAQDAAFLVPVVIDGTREPDARVPEEFLRAQWARLPGGETPLAFALRVRQLLAGEGSTGHATPVPVARPLPARRRTRPAKVAALGLAIVVAAIGLFFALNNKRIENSSPPGRTAPRIVSASIAVLPFTDLSEQGDQQYFSDGIAEELLNVLAKVDGLKVASRTSSFRFRNSDIGAPAIANELQVRHLLEGSVRRSGDRVRITAQLIDAGEDRHLWSEAYDRPLTAESAFAIQEDIANAVVGELAARIGATSHAVKVEADTANLEAYELYLKGRALFALRGGKNLAAGARALEKATSLDPRFARAWETLAMDYAVSQSWGVTDRDYRRLALDAADRAEQLDRALSAPYAVRGSVIFDMIGFGESDDWQASLTNLDEAIKRDPKNATAWFWRGIDFLVLGFFDRAITDIGRCVEIDPAYTYCGKWLAFAHLLAGHEDKALLLYERSKGAVFGPGAAFAAAYAGRGDNRSANSILAAQYADAPALVPALFRALTDPSFGDADRRKALALLIEERPAVGWTEARFFLGDYSYVAKDINSGLWWYRGDERYFKSRERKSHMRRFHLPDYWRAHGFPPQCRPIGADDFECH